MDGRVIHSNATLDHHFFKVPIAHAVGKIPAGALEYDLSKGRDRPPAGDIVK